MINTSIYGTPEQWGVANLGTTQNHADRKDSFLTAYFGGGGNTLDNGYGFGIDLNTPIDKSLSYCGLGGFSTWSKIEYYKRNRDLELIGKDNRTVTNFSFNQAVKISSMTGIWYSENSSWSPSRYGSRCRFAPNAINSASNENYNNGFIPITQIPIKNCVLVPIFRVAKQINTNGTTTGMDVATVTCWDYYGTTATRNHNTHPYILGIGFQFYTKSSDSSTTRTSVSSSTAAILDELALYKNVPVDLQRPDQNILNGGYSYCWNVPQSTFAYKHIFGYVTNGTTTVSNAIDYRANDLPSSVRTELLKAVAVFSHERAVFSDEWTVNTTTYARYYYLQYYDNGPDDNLREWVRKQLACFGLFFTDVSLSVAQSGEFDSEDMFLGILDENNIGQGVYSSGEDNRNQKQWTWETTNDSEYDPSGSGGGDDPYGDSNHYLNAHSYARGGKVYGTNDTGKWINLLNDINNIDIHADGFNDSVFYGQEPIECLIEGKLVFVNGLLGGVNMDANVDIELGQHPTSIKATRIRETYPYTADYGAIKISGVYNDFRDFEPYTSINLLLPFAGSIELPPAIAMYHSVHLYETIDLLTGDLFYTIHIDDIEFGRAYGNCALELSKNGLAVSQYAQMRYSLHEQSRRSYFNSAASLLGGMSGTGIAASYGNVAGVVTQSLGGAVNAANSFIDGSHTGMYNRHTSAPVAASDRISACVEYGRCIVPAIVVTSPRMIKDYSDADYKIQTGFATYKVGKIGDESGPVVCDTVSPSGLSCSAEEKRMIIEHLKRGIYIK